MKHLLFILFVFAAAVPARVLDGVVGVVGKETILFSELNEIVRISLQEGKTPSDTAMVKEMQRIMLDRFIDDRVLLEEAKAESVTVTEEEVSAMMNQQLDALTRQYGSLEVFEKEWERQTGIPFSDRKRRLRDEIRQNLLKKKFTDKFLMKTAVSRKEVEIFVNANRDSLPKEEASIHLSHIMLFSKPEAEAEKKAIAKMEQARARIQKGEAFEKVAVEISEGPGARDGGDIGFISRGALGLPEFEEAAFGLAAGEVSAIVRSQTGFHLIKAVEKNDRQVHVRHIMVLIAPDSQRVGNILARLDSVRSAVQDSAGFAQAALAISEDINTRQKGGMLGWYTRDRLSDEYLKAVQNLNPGEISRPVCTREACHLFRVNQVAKSRDLTLADDYAMLERITIQDKVRKQLEEKLKEWRTRFHVQNFLPLFESQTF